MEIIAIRKLFISEGLSDNEDKHLKLNQFTDKLHFLTSLNTTRFLLCLIPLTPNRDKSALITFFASKTLKKKCTQAWDNICSTDLPTLKKGS